MAATEVPRPCSIADTLAQAPGWSAAGPSAA
ncbi:hypothetical protein SZN_24990 [Streptomyces zinciresistens K42]|uniref:Uncharacterized protein n=1 Tax=Streptomyces zinciresistens K42 TaxID=700597 RepID=G2GHL1_9ACTN|nr:hypothetical protein SZN_24990 [Streptomyces zinciresistens K42]